MPRLRRLLTRSGSQSLHGRLPHSSTYDDNIIVWASARLAVFSHSWTHSGLVPAPAGVHRVGRRRRGGARRDRQGGSGEIARRSRREWIKKLGVGLRGLGIPILGSSPRVVDRGVQRALLQVLPILEPTFHPSSHGLTLVRGLAQTEAPLKARHQGRRAPARGTGNRRRRTPPGRC